MSNIYLCNTTDDCIMEIDLNNYNIKSLHLNLGGKPMGPRSIDIRGMVGAVINSSNNTISILDIERFKEVDNYFIGPNPSDVKLYNNYAYVSCNGSNSILVFNMEKKTVDFKIPSGNSPQKLTIDEEKKILLCANLLESSVSVIDLVKNDEIGRFKVGEYPVKALIEGDNIYVCENFLGENTHGHIGVYSLKNYEFIKKIDVGSMPVDLVKDNNTLYVSNFGDESISIVNIEKGVEESKIKIKGMPNSILIFNEKLYVSDYIYGKIYEVDCLNKKNKIIAVGKEPNAMILTTLNHQIEYL